MSSTPDASPDAAPDAPYVTADFSNSAGGDEDPNLLPRADGSLVLAWFSQRTGNGDIYYRRTTDGITWDAPVQVSSGTSIDVYPGLVEVAGTLHAVWHRYDSDPNTSSRIIYKRLDGSAEQTLTTGIAWSPTIATTASGTLVVAYAADPCAPSLPVCFHIAVVRSTDNGQTWSTEQTIVNSSMSDAIPYMARTGDHLTLVWNRYVATTTAELPYMAPTSDVMLSTSNDGITWTTPVTVAHDTSYNLFPALYADPAGAWWITWQTSGGVVAQPIAGTAPTATLPVTPVTGYSPRAAAVAGRSVVAWVEGSSDLEIWTRPF